MKNLLFVRIPSTCICFTLITLADATLSLLRGGDASLYLPVLFLWLAACQVIDHFLCKIPFKKWSQYCITESAVLYLLSLFVFGSFFRNGFSASFLISFTLIFLITDIGVFWYFHKRQEIQAMEINDLIRREQD